MIKCRNFFCFYWVKPGIDRQYFPCCCDNGREGYPEDCKERKVYDLFRKDINRTFGSIPRINDSLEVREMLSNAQENMEKK